MPDQKLFRLSPPVSINLNAVSWMVRNGRTTSLRGRVRRLKTTILGEPFWMVLAALLVVPGLWLLIDHAWGVLRHRRVVIDSRHENLMADVYGWTDIDVLHESTQVALHELPTATELQARMTVCTARVFVLPGAIGVQLDLPWMPVLGPGAVGRVEQDVRTATRIVAGYVGDQDWTYWTTGLDVGVIPMNALVVMKGVRHVALRPMPFRRAA